MFRIDIKSRKAIYEQIVDNFKRLITTGVLQENDKVPSIRDMAKTLTVNPNTIQKAYRELESQGYFYTVLGQGSFISAPPKSVSIKEIKVLYNSLRATVQELVFLGEKTNKIIDFINNECNASSNNQAETEKGENNDTD